MATRKATKKSTKKAPAKKAGATNAETLSQKLDRKRAEARERAEARRIAQEEFNAEYGEGHKILDSFMYEYETLGTIEGADPQDIGYFMESVREIANAIQRYLSHESRSLDDAFRVHRSKRYRQPAARKKYLHMYALQYDGAFLRRHGAKANEAFFELLARRHKLISKNGNPDTTLAKEWYYLKHKNLRPDPKKSKEGVSAEIRDQLDWLS